MLQGNELNLKVLKIKGDINGLKRLNFQKLTNINYKIVKRMDINLKTRGKK